MKLLVTGGAGFVGSHLLHRLVDAGHDVVSFDAYESYLSPSSRQYRPYLDHRIAGLEDEVEFVEGDTRNPIEVARTVERVQPDRIAHLAHLPITGTCEDHPEAAVDSIVQGTVNLLEAAKATDSVERFLYTSSSMVYGAFQYRPADEEHPRNPKGVYGGAKHAGETLTKSFCRNSDLDYTVVRPSAVYGPTDVNRRVSQIFVERALEGKPLALHDGGQQVLDFTYVEDTAQGFDLALTEDAAANETYNVTYGEGRTVKELAEVISEYVDGVETETKPVGDFRPKRGALDNSKAREELGFEPRFSLEEGMERYVEFVRSMGLVG
ncbi:NAD-dependent epimerase/dehydratase family protein [Haloarchaeobius baliensis]|uniref:NAD-dependent epimerase/dehydratase family protein n=1 Tax=Haloarchaeobius baliensis TaxID=1670458 RepID=UPI003F882CE5